MSSYQTDVLVIGAGIAGLSTALKLAEDNINVTLVSSVDNGLGPNSAWAQGGIIFENSGAKGVEELIEDIDKASAYTANLSAATVLAEEGGAAIEDILLNKAKSNFVATKSGELKFTQEAAHSRPRIIYKGDYTGREIQSSLLKYLNDFEHKDKITWKHAHTAIDLITANHHGKTLRDRYGAHKVLGAYLFDQKKKEVIKVMAKTVVLATGGFAGLYINSTNGSLARGDGHAMAYRAGAILSNMEFVQFHPTTFYASGSERRFLISEAVRGEGGKLINSRGERFMERYHEDLELAPRDVVARAIWNEMIETNSSHVYLDISGHSQSWLAERFPKIFEYCMQHEIDISKRPIPVVPSAHYTCGGVLVDLDGQTSIPQLYAVGEVACNGLHGANRLASTSLLEGLVFGTRVAKHIKENIDNVDFCEAEKIADWETGKDEVDMTLVVQDITTLKNNMWNYLGLIRSKNRLKRARAMFKELADEISRFYKHAELNDSLIGLRNSVEVALLVNGASNRNKKSIGCFFRED